MKTPAAADAAAVTIVIQTRVRDGSAEEFGLWEGEIAAAAAAFPGFIGRSAMPPNPPSQADWVILQRFRDADAATAWLHSDQRLRLIEAAQPILAGPVDVHLVRDLESGVLPAPISAVISTRIKPGHEGEYRKWEQRIAAAQAKAAGFQGYRFEPPIPGVQDDWLTILRFDTEVHLQAWLASPIRLKLLDEATAFTEEYHTRIVRTGFEQWFAGAPGTSPPVAWKQNMIVLLLLYPVVFLFGLWVQTPWLMKAAALPFWLALFIGNVISVLLLNVLVPRASRLLGWWLNPAREGKAGVTLAGALLLIALYAISMLIFSRLS
ncbi:MAG: antibiotic biosynthesis monooxygenase [Caulobacteraceae bacterium]